jgi:AcrR family transcriptional regulator
LGTRDPEATKRRILEAARREFSEKGIAGARVDAIAARAGVNKRMLYYYFGSKDDLFRRVLHMRLDEGRAEPQRDRDVLEPDRLSRRQRNLATDVVYVRLLVWEALEAGSGPVVNESGRRAYFEQWVASIEEKQRAGTVPAELDAAQLVLSELCLVLGPLVLPQLTRLVTGYGATSKQQLDRRAEFLDALEPRLRAGNAGGKARGACDGSARGRARDT